jgi:hypothetical protein
LRTSPAIFNESTTQDTRRLLNKSFSRWSVLV